MKIAAALNNQLISEHAARYALRYAQSLRLELELLHVADAHEPEQAIAERVERLTAEGGQRGVRVHLRTARGKPGPALCQLIQEHHYHTVFCSTRADPPRFFTDSVSQYLVRRPLPAQLAIVRINQVNSVWHCDRIGLFGGRGQPDVHQLALGLGLACAYDAEILLGNPLEVSRRNLRHLNLHQTREVLKSADHGFRSLHTLCQLSGVNSSVAHIPRGEDALDFFLSRKINLLVLSSRRLPRPIRHLVADPVENLFHLSPVNCLIVYPKV
jgi:hypothetical protein